ncbi:hypothetical protein M885DRAFT_423457, partial [Pelagophyceae sp. CCMP2097]
KTCCVCGAQNGKHCAKCKSRHYCGKACQLVDWKRGHNKACKQMAAEFQDRLLDTLMPAKLKVKEEPAIVADFVSADDSKAAARLPAVGSTVLVKASAPNGDTPDWRGTCAICLDLLPLDIQGHSFHPCCGKKICMVCSAKCEYDLRCPLCRAPASRSADEQLRLMQKHADRGNADAQLELGDSYKDGRRGLQRSWKRAFRLYSAAAKQGHAAGMHLTGRCLDLGDGVVKDCKAAFRMHLNAADQGFPEAQCRLGLMMVEGRGTEKSYPAAVEWFQLAANQGQPDALYILGGCYANGEGLVKDFGLALRWLRKAANVGYAGADEAVCEIEA